MSDDDGHVIPTSYDDEVLVEKAIVEVEESDSFTFGKIEFTITSRTDEPVRVELVDTLPGGWGEDRIGFHPDHQPEQWSLEDGLVEYEHDIHPDEEHTTMYAVRVDNRGDLDWLRHPVDVHVDMLDAAAEEADEAVDTMDDPETADAEADFGDDPGTDEMRAVETAPAGGGTGGDVDWSGDGAWADPAAENAGGSHEWDLELPEDEDQFSRDEEYPTPPEQDELSGDTAPEDGPDGWSAAEPDSPDQDVDTAEVDTTADLTAPPMTRGAPAQEAAAPPSNSGMAPETLGPDAPTEFDQLEGDDLVEDLLEALNERASPDQVEALGEALDRAAKPSLAARVDHLQKEYSDLAAYRDALEEFLDEQGGGRQSIEAIQHEQARLARRLDERVEQLEAALAREEELESVHDRLDDIDHRFENVREEMENARADQLDEVYERLDVFESQFDGLREEIEQAREDQLEDVHERVDAFESQFDDLRAEIENAREDQLEDVHERVDAFESQVDDLREDIAHAREDQLEDVHERIDGFNGRFDDLSEQVEATQAEIESVEGRVSQTLDDVHDATDRLEDSLGREMDELGETVDDLVEGLDDELAAVREDLESVRADLQETKVWQERIRETFANLTPTEQSAPEPEEPESDDSESEE